MQSLLPNPERLHPFPEPGQQGLVEHPDSYRKHDERHEMDFGLYWGLPPDDDAGHDLHKSQYNDIIRGGKTVIQAKRYTNIVPVTAVRDLYGTVLNEGAGRGILVTTSDYGPESYEFAKGKPLVLLNGSHLLSLLEKHGHKAVIDLRAAKRIIAQQGSTKIE
jgi:hypothetical protein